MQDKYPVAKWKIRKLSTVASGHIFTVQKRKKILKTQSFKIIARSKFGLPLTALDFILLKFNNSTVPNKKVRLGKNPKINNRTAYYYLDP